MALSGKLEIEVEIKGDADKFFNIFKCQSHRIPNISSEKTIHGIHSVEVHEGDWETPGSVKQWNYTLDGNAMNLKETVEAVDEEKKMIKFNIVDGELMKLYKRFTSTLQVIAKEEGGIVKYTFAYEKLSDDVPDPDSYLDFAAKITKDIDDHHYLLKD